MTGVNKHILIGNLGKDPEIRATQSGNQMASFSIATSERWRDSRTGEQKESTTWHNIVITDESMAKIAGQYLKKGSKVYLEGQVFTRKYTTKDGSERQITETVLRPFRGKLVLLDRAERAPVGDDASYSRGSLAPAAPLDDDIPF